MAQDYKEKLKNHLAKLPDHPGAISSGSPTYTGDAEQKKQILAGKLAIVNNADFTHYSGMTHKRLLENWAGGGIMTSCNSFAGGCTTAMCGVFLGHFKLEALLKKLGKEHAWVPASSGRRPEYGDIFTTDELFPPRLHQGISLGFDGDTWLTAEGGKGGRKTGVDIIRRNRSTFRGAAEWAGWCDMRLFTEPPLPDWLPGTWVIYHGSDTYYYRFNKFNEVTQEPHRLGASAVGTVAIDAGTFVLGPDDSVIVTWRTEGGTERFKYDRWNSFPGIMERMTGAGAKGEPLSGVRL